MTTDQLVLDSIQEMEKRGIKPEWSDFEAIAELYVEESKLKEEVNNDTRRID